jgi:hypothetical protein
MPYKYIARVPKTAKIAEVYAQISQMTKIPVKNLKV